MVPKGDLRKVIMNEAHNSLLSIHPGSTKMYHDLKQSYWWTQMKREIAQLVNECDVCMSAFWERGSPDLPACGLRRGSKGGPARPIFTNTNPRPSQGAKPRGADDAELPQARPRQAGSQGGGEIKAGSTSRGAHDASHDDETRQAPGGRQPGQCPCFPFGAKGASAGAEYRGITQRLPFWCNKTRTRRTARRRSSWSRRRRHQQSLWKVKTTFFRIACTSCPPSNLPAIVGSLPAQDLGRGLGPL